jgi:hypothetical protein
MSLRSSFRISGHVCMFLAGQMRDPSNEVRSENKILGGPGGREHATSGNF